MCWNIKLVESQQIREVCRAPSLDPHLVWAEIRVGDELWQIDGKDVYRGDFQVLLRSSVGKKLVHTLCSATWLSRLSSQCAQATKASKRMYACVLPS